MNLQAEVNARTPIFIAEGICGRETPPLIIVGTEPIPESKYREGQDGYFEQQASEIADRLESSLPGGTWDRLVAEIVKRHASRLVVGYCFCPDRHQDGHTGECREAKAILAEAGVRS